VNEPVVPNELIDAAGVALKNPPVGITLVGPRASATRQDGNVQQVAIQDQMKAPMSAGRYRLTVVCAGSGSLTIRFSIDAQKTEGTLSQCSPNTAYYIDELVAPESAEGTTAVQIVPAPGTVAGIGYRIDLVS
jgi:hypothetical protein